MYLCNTIKQNHILKNRDEFYFKYEINNIMVLIFCNII